jgi:C4-type Zn-finger protein
MTPTCPKCNSRDWTVERTDDGVPDDSPYGGARYFTLGACGECGYSEVIPNHRITKEQAPVLLSDLRRMSDLQLMIVEQMPDDQT